MINIYKASAGSGKTHKLTGEYIKLLFRDNYAYKHILAVTFTNKATDEMKQRILQELYNLSLPNSKSDYIEELCKVYNKSEFEIRAHAKKVLILILHDYSAFSISTIDKFFQGVMRAFARELGKIATYNVELDQDSVIIAAIDRMFSDLEKAESEDLLNWLIEYSLEAIDSGDSWSVKKEIFSMARELFSEDYKLKRKEGEFDTPQKERANIIALKERVKEIKEAFESELCAIGKRGVECMNSCGLSYLDFKGTSRSPFKYFVNVLNLSGLKKIAPPGKAFINLYNNLNNWSAGKKVPTNIETAYNNGLNECVGDMILHFEKNYTGYVTARVIGGNINTLGILDDIYARVLGYCKEKNIMLLSEANMMLNSIIDGSDTPFIYEKIGTRLDNFMLDEFQDTSVLQWRNFHPLLSDSLAQGNSNLIVGDVKQSIYRWRGSDWNILNSLIYQEFNTNQIEDFSLDCNWRSGKNIVDFNNEFFTFSANMAQKIFNEKCEDENDKQNEVIKGIFSDFKQSVPQKGIDMPGYVEVNFMPEEEIEESTLNLIVERINSLVEDGNKLSDIAVLVRKNKTGKIIANKLINSNIPLVSADSLFVNSSYAVQRLLAILKKIDNPDSIILTLESGIISPESEDTIYELMGRSLYEICEEIIRKYLSEKEREDIAFLQAFLDLVQEYSNREGSYLSGFLKWWDDCGDKKFISPPNEQNAVNLMSIHKSKGLGFKVVIIPFFNEKLDGRTSKIWSNSEEHELNYNKPLPLNYVSDLKFTHFKDDYYKEMLYNYIDNLNTAYVAFTRPKEQLIIISHPPKVNSKGEISATLSTILDDFYSNTNLDFKQEVTPEGVKKITHGIPLKKEMEPTPTFKGETIDIFNSPLNYKRSRIALISGSIGDEESIREYGIAMHHIFSLINSENDIANAVQSAFDQGITEISPDKLINIITEKISGVKEYGWFEPTNSIYNECDIILTNGDIARPDRVVINGEQVTIIDYKFGAYSDHSPMERAYIKQVRRYMELFNDMGYTDITGYIWYPQSGEVISV